MKTMANASLWVVSLLLAGNLLFSSCDNENNDPETTSVPLIASVLSYSNAGVLESTDSFQYDNQGRTIKVDHHDLSYTTIEYSDSTMLSKNYEDGELMQRSILILNSKGQCTSISIEESNEIETYEYYSNDYLKSMIFEDDTMVYTSTFTVFEGNYVTINSESNIKTTNSATINELGNLKSSFLPTNLKKSMTPLNRLKSATTNYISKTDCQFYKDKTNTIGNENIGILFLGKQDKNSIKQEIITYSFDSGYSHTDTITYTYEYDTKGRITRQTSNEGNYTLYTYVD